MTRACLAAQLGQIGLLCKAQRQCVRADMYAANAALERAEAFAAAQIKSRDAALGIWTGVLSDRLASPELIAQAGAWVLDREHKLDEAKRAAKTADHRAGKAADALSEASARDEVAQTLRGRAVRLRDRHLDERLADEVQDILRHRRLAWR